MANQPVLIGRLAALSDVTVRALRIYERRGLIAPLFRATNGYRCYDASLQLPIRVFGTALSIGLSLADIGEVFAAVKPLQREPTQRESRALLTAVSEVYRRHIERINDQVSILQNRRAFLESRIAHCTNELKRPAVRIGYADVQRRAMPGRIEYRRVADPASFASRGQGDGSGIDAQTVTRRVRQGA